MSTLTFAPGEYNEASGTRDAFGRLSDDLVAEGLPPIRVVSGDRSPQAQIDIFVARFRQQASGSGPYGDVRFWDGTAWGYPGGSRWVRWSSAGTVAEPFTSNHGKKRSNDLGWPYNSLTWQHARARELAKRHNITCDGLGFGEAWHWTHWGPLGSESPAGGGTPIEEDDMTEPRVIAMIEDIQNKLSVSKDAGYGRPEVIQQRVDAILGRILPAGQPWDQLQLLVSLATQNLNAATSKSVDVPKLIEQLRTDLSADLSRQLREFSVSLRAEIIANAATFTVDGRLPGEDVAAAVDDALAKLGVPVTDG